MSHIYRALRADGYRGTKIHNLYRDEVQDFTQAELLLDMRCAPSCCCRQAACACAYGVHSKGVMIRSAFLSCLNSPCLTKKK